MKKILEILLFAAFTGFMVLLFATLSGHLVQELIKIWTNLGV